MEPVDPNFDDPSSEPIDRLVIDLRAYVKRAPEAKKKGKTQKSRDRKDFWQNQPPRSPSEWVLVFDCETRTTPDQRLRFGAYQLRYRGQIAERGAFYEPDVLTPDELSLLRQVMDEERALARGERVRLRNRAEFVEKVFYEFGYEVGAQIVGFNLPFDLSRLAIRHASARGSMRGGFSLTLSARKRAIAVKHLSQKSAFIRVTGPRPPEEDDEDPSPDAPHEIEKPLAPDQGYFVDLKTLAAALTSQSHSLASLSEVLRVAHPKKETEEHGGALTTEYIHYALLDVQTTWECFEALAQRFESFGLADTGFYDLYSEASLGKAYLKTMKIKPWREVQPDFPPALIGNILSAYYGGRSEVHIRRQITSVIHTDFLSMYPTVCTLMGLWEFVRANGVTHRSNTAIVRKLIDTPRDRLVEHLQNQHSWRDLKVLVQVLPRRDLFPIRAQYPDGDAANIGLNYLTTEEPQWFTLADVLVSKILTGKTPNIVKAIRFEPKELQAGLAPIAIEGVTIDPSTEDFYRRLIIHRNALKAEYKAANEADKPGLRSAEQGVKILANATSYGIFVELNIEDYRTAKPMIGYGARSRPFRFKSKKYEKPGKFFHPLLATLITGAARLMLALAEYQVIDHG